MVDLIYCLKALWSSDILLSIFFTSISNKLLGQILDITPKKIIFLKKFNAEFSFIEVLFTDQSSKPLEIKHEINITLIIN